jgi:hypothetical protein
VSRVRFYVGVSPFFRVLRWSTVKSVRFPPSAASDRYHQVRPLSAVRRVRSPTPSPSALRRPSRPFATAKSVRSPPSRVRSPSASSRPSALRPFASARTPLIVESVRSSPIQVRPSYVGASRPYCRPQETWKLCPSRYRASILTVFEPFGDCSR